MAEVYRIQEIAYDRWNASQLVTQLMNDGATMVPFGQGYQSMNAPTKELLTLVTGRKLRHGGNPVLRWMASNVAAKQDPADNLKPDKAKSAEKIDGVVAGIMALGRAMVAVRSDSIYEQRGPQFV
jgi:phage terminase large subunit-like protein